jgi:enterochelin esterase-like enzyme
MSGKSNLILLIVIIWSVIPPSTIAQAVAAALPKTPGFSKSASSVILEDGRVVFKITAPDAGKIQINLGRLYDLVKDDQGTFSVTTDPQVPGFHYYSLIIDGVPVADAYNEIYYGTGKYTNGIEIPEKNVDFYNIKNVPHGQMFPVWYFSPKANTWRRMFVYTPPYYNSNIQMKYPVLYLQHGAGEDERSWGSQGKLVNIMDNLIASGESKPMLVVMSNEYMVDDIGAGYNTESTNRFMDMFGDELTQVIIPYIESNFRVIGDCEHRVLAGLSMGGGIAFRVGIKNPDYFSSIGVFSSSAFRGQGDNIFDAEKLYPGILTHPAVFNNALKLLYISTGEQDPSFVYTAKAVNTFREHGLKVEYNTFSGAHEWQVWRKALHDFTPRLFAMNNNSVNHNEP